MESINIRLETVIWQAPYLLALNHALFCISLDLYWDTVWYDEHPYVRPEAA